MSIAIRFLEHPPLLGAAPDNPSYDRALDFQKFEVGDLAFYHWQGVPCLDMERRRKLHLTAHYFTQNSARPPLILALPDKATKGGKLCFMVDGQCYSNKCTRCGKGVGGKCKCPGEWTVKGYYDGWMVSGAPPHITVSPSVNYDDDEHNIKHYHGFIKEGVIGDG